MTNIASETDTPAHDSTDQRLLSAAERLFAERGVDAVSLRAIMAAAGTNVASVHYHFGSKERLIEALLDKYLNQLEKRRFALLDIAERAGTLRAIAEAIVVPLSEIGEEGGTAWLSTLGKLLISGHPALIPMSVSFQPQAARLQELIVRLRPKASLPSIRFGVTQAVTLTCVVLGDIAHTNRLMSLSGTYLDDGQMNAQLIDMVTAILAGPPAEN
ncbi:MULTISPECIES: TetR/AcrR family transcriptional regulator [Mycobacteroides]|uniref:TetR/AcrR family transcriptional regulator n=1 Tax=Mycobacteroides TaxID=670516 RepID=UPI0008A90679|nr:helix-turn-helix domain-containing protein [Mycobacteroides chelonae]AYM40858.1 TetR/AcrR family transcriptional regulator [[Mycobacterium] chelonae subsp. gwanakae]MBV0918725.1 TetR/AcrR family transcriptional regulator [Mycobacteroides chelonae]OHT80683.1 TetR family transcriptional regulator [Mycobacteroides chelonae]OHU16433.1 TetR family transcriptional regulator [Mycobacteroides chelonae]GLE57210.1 putative transcriptional regulator, TetR family protein [Mycobacteroides chelonae]